MTRHSPPPYQIRPWSVSVPSECPCGPLRRRDTAAEIFGESPAPDYNITRGQNQYRLWELQTFHKPKQMTTPLTQLIAVQQEGLLKSNHTDGVFGPVTLVSTSFPANIITRYFNQTHRTRNVPSYDVSNKVCQQATVMMPLVIAVPHPHHKNNATAQHRTLKPWPRLHIST